MGLAAEPLSGYACRFCGLRDFCRATASRLGLYRSAPSAVCHLEPWGRQARSRESANQLAGAWSGVAGEAYRVSVRCHVGYSSGVRGAARVSRVAAARRSGRWGGGFNVCTGDLRREPGRLSAIRSRIAAP
jgi:hypothetical protein